MKETGCLCSSYTCGLVSKTKKGAVTSGTWIVTLGEQSRREGRPFSGAVRVGQLHRGGGTRPWALCSHEKSSVAHPEQMRFDPFTVVFHIALRPSSSPRAQDVLFHIRTHLPPQQPLALASVFRLSFPILFPIWDPNAAHTSSVNE